ncbi:hypothetical protein K0M31_004346 [Melipona bicolor]|uniref:Uncharacterized protein n=1 Tax=Melipona bicolor TaxID=60889 RepID=A0AA40FWK7_9HYME|nr:hypothetical protein K0M31_004346 [Melipona bicolor]
MNRNTAKKYTKKKKCKRGKASVTQYCNSLMRRKKEEANRQQKGMASSEVYPGFFFCGRPTNEEPYSRREICQYRRPPNRTDFDGESLPRCEATRRARPSKVSNVGNNTSHP